MREDAANHNTPETPSRDNAVVAATNRVEQATAPAPASHSETSRNDALTQHRAQLLEQVHRQFHAKRGSFHFKDKVPTLAFEDKGTRLVSTSNERRVATAMATLAEAKGWKAIKVSGHREFRRDVWVESRLRGLDVHGYVPSKKDLEDLAIYKTQAGLKFTRKEVRHPEQLKNHRAQPKSERQHVTETVAAAVIEAKVKNPAVRLAIQRSIQLRLDERAKTNRVPAVSVYDKSAPSRLPPQERDRPQAHVRVISRSR